MASRKETTRQRAQWSPVAFFKGFSIISVAIFSFKEKHTSLSVPQKRPTQCYVVLHRKLEGVN